MPTFTDVEIIERLVTGEHELRAGILALIDRTKGIFTPTEDTNLDFKESVDIEQHDSIGELARDILAFANTTGGLVIVGVEDRTNRIVGFEIDERRLRQALLPFVGTRVEFQIEKMEAVSIGVQRTIVVIVVHKSRNTRPNLLRIDVLQRGILGRKPRYKKGTLFFRVQDHVQSEPDPDRIELKAVELGFMVATPRTGSAFLLLTDEQGDRIYEPINDRFFGRNDELGELLNRFEDKRTRGISLTGIGGFGKTELAIKLTHELKKRNVFKFIYSGSAKQSALSASGYHSLDPVFTDHPSFLRDLASWLGTQLTAPEDLVASEKQCIGELKQLNGQVLLFVDNLETVTDQRLFKFLDNALPANCWLLTTSRISKLRNSMFVREIGPLDERSAKLLLRHELRKYGLREQADRSADDLKKLLVQLHHHPLTVRWFAFAAQKTPTIWNQGFQIPMDTIESFCLESTLNALADDEIKAAAAIVALQGSTTVTREAVEFVSGLSADKADLAAIELQNCGFVYELVDSLSGEVRYQIAPLAQGRILSKCREMRLEGDLTKSVRKYVEESRTKGNENPEIRELVEMHPKWISTWTEDQRRELNRRIDRLLPSCNEFSAIILRSLKAECFRHDGNTISSDETYRACAEAILGNQELIKLERMGRILLEAATVSLRKGNSPHELRRRAQYLEPVLELIYPPFRPLGMLADCYSELGDQTNFDRIRRIGTEILSKNESTEQSKFFEEVLTRASERLKQSQPRRRAS